MKEETGRDPGEAADNSRHRQQWQINLLDHIDAVQDEVSHRMDFIERELDGKCSRVMLIVTSAIRNMKVSACSFV